MKIFTYYENIEFKQQNELIVLWSKSWRARGFKPAVLTELDAKKSDYYEEFVSEITRLHLEIAQKPLSSYGLSCWVRWLAYSTQPEEKFYVGDYDVINHSFSPKDPTDTLHLLDHCCPCLASGTPSQFLKLCKKFVEVSEQNKENFAELYKTLDFKHFHDQNFFILYFHGRKDDSDPEIKLSRDRNFISCPQHDKFWEKPLVHYSHRGCGLFCEKLGVKSNDARRCDIIRGHINK